MAQRGTADTDRSRPTVRRAPRWTVTADVGEDIGLDGDEEMHHLPRPALLCAGGRAPART
ncbi:hypothetical protein [Streptomyces kanasensis]|uniref:hypothetical protein n=1 Tax=Streptomyces kanasensis TaxID=936756 RepID=UPI0037029739